MKKEEQRRLRRARKRKLRVERNMSLVQSQLERMRARLFLPEYVWKDANDTCRTVIENKLMPGKPPNAVAASSIYSCCRQNQLPVGLN